MIRRAITDQCSARKYLRAIAALPPDLPQCSDVCADPSRPSATVGPASRGVGSQVPSRHGHGRSGALCDASTSRGTWHPPPSIPRGRVTPGRAEKGNTHRLNLGTHLSSSSPPRFHLIREGASRHYRTTSPKAYLDLQTQHAAFPFRVTWRDAWFGWHSQIIPGSQVFFAFCTTAIPVLPDHVSSRSRHCSVSTVHQAP